MNLLSPSVIVLQETMGGLRYGGVIVKQAKQLLGNPTIASVAVAAPHFTADQAEVERHLLERYSDGLSSRSRLLLHNLLSHPSIRKRSFAIEDPRTFLSEDPDARISRFTRWAVDLSSEATEKALLQAGASTSEVAAIVVNTCTGYICPGISTYLIEKLGHERHIRVYDLVGSGGGGAIPNLEVAGSLTRGLNGKVVVSVSVEICTATFQMGNDLSLLVSNALFGDGAAAAVLWNRPEGLVLIASSSRYVPEDREAIRYVHKNGHLHNQLSTKLPHLVKKAVAQAVRDVLQQRSLKVKNIRHWALHTGGEKIINTVKAELGLSEEQLGPTRTILAEYGNMSSPTVWFLLDHILARGVEKGDFCIMVAFGAGLSAHVFLLRKV
jgi:predicted naringenin-chalcone synthase